MTEIPTRKESPRQDPSQTDETAELAALIRERRGPVPGTVPEGTAPAAASDPPRLSKRDLWLGRARRALRRAYRLPGLGYALFLIAGIARLPRYLQQLQRVEGQTLALDNRLHVLGDRLQRSDAERHEMLHRLGRKADEVAVTDRLEDIYGRVSQIYSQIETVQAELARDMRTLDEETRQALIARLEEELLQVKRSTLKQRSDSVKDTALKQPTLKQRSDSAMETASAVPPDLALFYMGLEQRFRGSAEAVAARQKPYLDRLQTLPESVPRQLVDLGCGRGEFLGLAQGIGWQATGIDLNAIAVAEAREAGHDALEADAIAYLQTLPPDSLGAVSGFHLIEHVPLESLIALIDAALTALAPGGIALFETPNPETLPVGAHTFWLDPTHQKPLPPGLAQYMLEARGYRAVEILRLNPSDGFQAEKPADAFTAELDRLIRGPRDYAVIGVK